MRQGSSLVRNTTRATRSGTVFALALCSLTTGAQVKTKPFTPDPTGATKARLGYFPIPLKLSAEKPVGIKKEPTYTATPKYATLRMGNGPKSEYLVAVDEPESGDFKVYVDANRNGDLTDDGAGAWKEKKESNGRTFYGVNEYVLRASYGTAKKESGSAEYGIGLYRFTGSDILLMYRQGARSGEVVVDGKAHKALLAENDADGVYSKSLDDSGKPIGGGTPTRPVWLLVDLNDDGKFDEAPLDVRSPFKLAGKPYEAYIAADGSKLDIKPTTRKVPDAPKVAERPPLLKAGTPAPDFAVEVFGAGTTRLSDLKGKVVVLDFWATWCGPCMKSMPHLEKVYQAVKGKDVSVLAVCVWDEKKAYDEWVPKNREKFSFPLAFDPAGRSDSNIAAKLYKVSGIPTTYIIDKEGKVAEAIVGYDDNDTRVEAALKKLGVEVEAAGK